MHTSFDMMPDKRDTDAYNAYQNMETRLQYSTIQYITIQCYIITVNGKYAYR